MKKLSFDKLIHYNFKIRAKKLYDYSLYLYQCYLEFYLEKAGFPEFEFKSEARKALEKHVERETKQYASILLAERLKINEQLEMEFFSDPIKHTAVELIVHVQQFYSVDDIKEKELEDKKYFRLLSLYCKFLSVAYENIDEFVPVLENTWDKDYQKYGTAKLLSNPPKILLNPYSLLDNVKEIVLREANTLIGYWLAKGHRIKASRPGIEKKQENKRARIAEIKTLLEKSGNYTAKGLEIDRGEWEEIFRTVFEQKVNPSYPTFQDYKARIEHLISKEKGDKIEIILKK